MRRMLLGTVLFAGGCLPVPHTMQDLPRVTGVITSYGTPVEGARIQVADVTRTNPCLHAERVATTTASGDFASDGRRGWDLLVWLLPYHNVDTWAVAIFRDAEPLGFIRPWHYRAGPRYAPGDVRLHCDLGSLQCDVDLRTGRSMRSVRILPCTKFARDAFTH